MKKNILLLLLLFGGSAFVGCNSNNNINSMIENINTKQINYLNAKTSNDVFVASTYLLNETLNVPSVSLTFENKKYDATSYVRYPSGVYSESKKIKLNEAGEYNLIYIAKYKDKYLYNEHSFNVTNELYSIIGTKSKAYYGTHEYMKDTPGIIASIKPNEQLIFNKPIDLTTYKKTDNILTFNVLPSTIGIADAKKIIIKLTDVYDSDNFITIELKKYDANMEGWGEIATYSTAYGNGQIPCGLEEGAFPGNGRVVELYGTDYTIHQNDAFGARSLFAMTGAPKYESLSKPNYEVSYVGTQSYSVSMDYENGIIYGGKVLSIINDLRSDIVYGSNFWQGFTTGEAYLSISATNYNSDALNIIIESVDGVSTNEFTENKYVDDTKPELEILWDKEIPNGLVNHNYPLFEAKGYDEFDHEEKEVSTSVYLNYGLDNQVSVPIVNNGFIPLYKSIYYIEYKVKDNSGNENVKVVSVNVSDNVNVIDVDTISSSKTSYNLGEIVDISKLTYKNSIGEYKEKITATLESDPSISYEVKDYQFIPLNAGKYKIDYDYSDYMFAGNYNYEIEVKESNVPVIFDDIQVLKYYIKDCEYVLPTYYGYTFENGKAVLKPLDIYIKEENSEKLIENNKFVPTKAGKTTIVYLLKDGNNEARKEIEANIIDVGYETSLDMGKYFNGDNFTYKLDSKFITYTLNKNETSSLDFINALSSSYFSFKFSADETLNNFKKINVYLTDASDENIKIKFTYEKEPTGYVKFYINDASATSYKTLFASSDNPIILGYNNDLVQVSPQPSNYQLVKETLYGQPFNGFVSDNMYLSIEVEGVEGASAIKIINVNGQQFTKIKADIIEPKVYVKHDVGDHNINQVYTIEKATIFDVLDPNFQVSFTVKDPDGKYITAENGMILDGSSPYNYDYDVKFTKYGTHYVNYVAKDSNENTTSYAYVITVIDKVSPVVEVIKPVTKGKVGDIINIASLSITDNNSEKFNIYVSLKIPSGRFFSLTENKDGEIITHKSFTALEKGVYEISYMVFDDAGNSSIASYEITIE